MHRKKERALSKMQKSAQDFCRTLNLHFSPPCFSLPKDYLFLSPFLSALIPSPIREAKDRMISLLCSLLFHRVLVWNRG